MQARALLCSLSVIALLTAACGGSTPASPAGPSTPTPPSQPGGPTSTSCRILPTSATLAYTATGFSGTTQQTCSFAAATNQVTCTSRYSDSTGQSSVSTTVATYASVGDLVDEIRVIPPAWLALSTATSTTGTGGSSSNSTAHTYDAQRRLTRIVGTSAAGTSTSTYTAWDASGRPTAGRDIGPGFDNAVAISYDNGQRTRTTVFGNNLLTTVETFDANGNPIRQVTLAGATTSSTTVITPLTTQQICR